VATNGAANAVRGLGIVWVKYSITRADFRRFNPILKPVAQSDTGSPPARKLLARELSDTA
jgi:hypothetical protein